MIDLNIAFVSSINLRFLASYKNIDIEANFSSRNILDNILKNVHVVDIDVYKIIDLI